LKRKLRTGKTYGLPTFARFIESLLSKTNQKAKELSPKG
jgi:hypothetical protein